MRLLRVLMRVMFRAAAVAALVWIGRELMRRWVNGTEEPQVAGGWETWKPDGAASSLGTPAAGRAEQRAGGASAKKAAGGPAAGPAAPEPAAPEPAAPAKKARPKKAAARQDAPARAKSSEPAPSAEPAAAGKPAAVGEPGAPGGAAGEPGPAAPGPSPARRRQRPLKATRLPKAAAEPWVSPNGSGEAPATHPVKAKLVSRLYRVPGMPMYNRTVPDRCYETPEAAEADGFTRAAR